MKYFYGEFDGQEFPTQDKLFSFDQLMNFIMQYGEQALKAIEKMLADPKDEQQSEMLEQLLEDGMLDKDGKGKLRLTPKAVGRMQQRALMEVIPLDATLVRGSHGRAPLDASHGPLLATSAKELLGGAELPATDVFGTLMRHLTS